jgi:hypothetical protein
MNRTSHLVKNVVALKSLYKARTFGDDIKSQGQVVTLSDTEYLTVVSRAVPILHGPSSTNAFYYCYYRSFKEYHWFCSRYMVNAMYVWCINWCQAPCVMTPVLDS